MRCCDVPEVSQRFPAPATPPLRSARALRCTLPTGQRRCRCLVASLNRRRLPAPPATLPGQARSSLTSPPRQQALLGVGEGLSALAFACRPEPFGADVWLQRFMLVVYLVAAAETISVSVNWRDKRPLQRRVQLLHRGEGVGASGLNLAHSQAPFFLRHVRGAIRRMCASGIIVLPLFRHRRQQRLDALR